jgi:hypothetical protein
MRKPTVLIMSPDGDAHAIAIAEVLRSHFSVEAIIWDTSDFPGRDRVSMRLHDDIDVLYCKLDRDLRTVNAGDLKSIWWRRPQPVRPPDSIQDPEVRGYCFSEASAFFRGALSAVDLPIVNDPDWDTRANRKPHQLKTALDVGLCIPETLMTNDPNEVLRFKEQTGDCIYKAFTAPSWRLVETRRLEDSDMAELYRLRYAPMIVQEHVKLGRDIRVMVIGDDVYAAAVKSGGLDWRLDPTADWERHELPPEVAQGLVTFTKRLHLHYGCIDLRLDPDGDYYFLEINPSGQFLFLEIETGLPLAREFSRMLLDPPCV